MKRFLLILLGLGVMGGLHAEIIFRAEPPPIPAQVAIVPVAPWPMSYETFRRRALQLGVRGEVTKSPRGLVMRAGPLLFQQDPLGSEFYADTDRLMAAEPGEVPPLPDSAAARIAKGYLQDHPGRVQISEAQYLRVSHLFNQGEDLQTGRRTPATQDESIVIFQRRIGNLAVIPAGGTGDHIRIHVSNNGDVVGRRQTWRNARGAGNPMPSWPYGQAQNALIESLSEEMGTNQRQDAIITKIEYGLYSRPEGEPQRFLQPAYVFTVELYDREEQQTTGARLIPIPGVNPAALQEPLDIPPTPPETGNPDKILFHASPPQLPRALPAVQIEPVSITNESIRRRAALLGLPEGRIIQTPRGLGFTYEHLLLFQDPEGTELFGDTERMMAEPPGEENPIAEAEAISIARRHLNLLGDIGPGDVGTPIVRRLRQQTFDTVNQRAGPETQDEAIVEFPRLLPLAGYGSIPLIGPGAFIRVHVDNTGRITGHHRVWRKFNLQSTEPLPLRETQAIQQEFTRQILSELGKSIAVVTDIKAGLFLRAEGLQQGFAQPALLYEVDLMDEATGAVTAHRQIPVPAANELKEPLDDPDAQLGVSDPGLQSARDSANIPLLFGDMNDDGQLDLVDVAICIQIAGGLAAPDTERQFIAGDVVPAGNPLGDDKILLHDALRILRGCFNLDDLNPAS